ncbi:MAG: ribonuclease HII [Chloroflexi bacterium]|nr:ribonuclease HII [Chloroflexota bacterium]
MAPRLVKITAPAWPDLSFEDELNNAGKNFIAGIDEAGRGAWAGPVSAAAVILPLDQEGLSTILGGVRDSKQMSPGQREKWAEIITINAVAAAIGWAEFDEIDKLGIVPATRLAMKRAVTGLNHSIDHLLIDAVKLPDVDIPQTSLIKGDSRSLSIAAASVLAKVSRDRLMKLLEKEYPGYGFDRHKGYGTAAHQKALKSLGVSTIHRRSYAPIKRFLE